MPRKILLVNGPNLNMLGTREPEIYGSQTLADIEAECKKLASELGLELDCVQSNHEGELVDHIQKAGKTHAGLLINAGAYTHTSVAIMDALMGVDIPVIEVHMSNIYKREEFRHHSYISKTAVGVICGFGAQSYLLGLRGMKNILSSRGACQ